jgi:hypothetical protein
MAILEIDKPDAFVDLVWVPAGQGGRTTGPPTAPVYQSTAVFEPPDERERVPDWPTKANAVSILVQRLGLGDADVEQAKIAFIAPDLARPLLHPGGKLLVMEGPKVVAELTVREVLPGSAATGGPEADSGE